jgi:hypothetical protein
MKTLTILLKRGSSFRSLKVFILLALLSGSLSSCFKHYYQTNSVKTTDASALKQLQAQGKLFIVHTPTYAFALKNITIDSIIMSGTIEDLNPKSDAYLNPGTDFGNKLARKDEAAALNEVHFYTNSSFDGSNLVNLEIKQINRMDVYGRDKKANRESSILSVVGITVGTAAIVGVAAAAANSASHIVMNVDWSGH